MNSTKLLKPTDIAERLNISKTKAYGILQNREIPVIMIGGSLRVKEDHLEEWIEKQTKPSRHDKTSKNIS